MCMVDDESGPSFHTVTHPRARKEHRCGDCGRTIRRGEPYEYVTGCWDGRIAVIKTCGQCEAARAWISVICLGFVYGQVGTELRDHFEEGYGSVPLGRLIVGLRHRWVSRGDLIPVEVVKAWTDAAVAAVPVKYRGRAA